MTDEDLKLGKALYELREAILRTSCCKELYGKEGCEEIRKKDIDIGGARGFIDSFKQGKKDGQV